MDQKCETPHDGGVSRISCVGSIRDSLTPQNLQAQFLIASHNVRPALSVMIAALAFGGHNNA